MKIIKTIILNLFIPVYLPLFLSILFPLSINGQTLPQKKFPESQFVEVEGVNIHFRTWKPINMSAKGKILMVHGFCGSTFSWRNNIKALTEKGYEVTAVDLPPFGYSDKTRYMNHSISAQAYLIWHFLDFLDAQNNAKDSLKWILMGHSMGGGVIAAMSAMRPTETHSLILVDAAVMSSNKNNVSGVSRWFFGTDYLYRIGEFAGKYYFFHEKRIEKLLLSAYGLKPDKEAVIGYLEGMKTKGTAGGIMQMAASKELYDFDIQNIQCPSLLIWGEKDTWVPVKQGEMLKSRLKNARLEVVKGAAHCAMETHADIFNSLVLNFLDSH